MSARKQLERMLRDGLISRREFVVRMSALGAGAALSGLPAGSAFAAMPKKGGHFRAGSGHGSTTDSLDPATFENNFMQFVLHGFRNMLTEIDVNSGVAPELAESWEASADAKTWTFSTWVKLTEDAGASTLLSAGTDGVFINADGKAEIEEAKCQGCGNCAAACPAKAIQLRTFTDRQERALFMSMLREEAEPAEAEVVSKE